VDPALPADERARLQKRVDEIQAGVAGDALLYLAPAAELMESPFDATLWMDEDYRKEIDRRLRIRGETPISYQELIPLTTAPPVHWKP
jgi:hypothetical protein